MEKVEAFQCSYCATLYLRKSDVVTCEKKCLKKKNEQEAKKQKALKYKEQSKFIANTCSSLSLLPRMIEQHIKDTSNGIDEWHFTQWSARPPRLTKEWWDKEEQLRVHVSYEAKRVKGESDFTSYFDGGWHDSKAGVRIFGFKTGSGGGGNGGYSGELTVILEHFKLLYDDALQYVKLRSRQNDFARRVGEANYRISKWLNANAPNDSIIKSINGKISYINKVTEQLTKQIIDRQNELVQTKECIEFTAVPEKDYDEEELKRLIQKFG